jgi:uncharacterized membrane protein YhaH (DUF805 family)
MVAPRRVDEGKLHMNITTAVAHLSLNPFIAAAVFCATVVTDAVYVLFTAAVVARRRVRAATWSSVWYLLSAFAVINYTGNPVYVLFAALGSWIGAYLSVTWLNRAQPAAAPVRPGPP